MTTKVLQVLRPEERRCAFSWRLVVGALIHARPYTAVFWFASSALRQIRHTSPQSVRTLTPGPGPPFWKPEPCSATCSSTTTVSIYPHHYSPHAILTHETEVCETFGSRRTLVATSVPGHLEPFVA